MNVVDLTADFICREKERGRYNRAADGAARYEAQIGQLLAIDGKLIRRGGSYIPVYVRVELQRYAAQMGLSLNGQ